MPQCSLRTIQCSDCIMQQHMYMKLHDFNSVKPLAPLCKTLWSLLEPNAWPKSSWAFFLFLLLLSARHVHSFLQLHARLVAVTEATDLLRKAGASSKAAENKLLKAMQKVAKGPTLAQVKGCLSWSDGMVFLPDPVKSKGTNLCISFVHLAASLAYVVY